MKPIIKSKEEIEIMRQGGKILSRVLKQVVKMAKPGVGTVALDEFAEEEMRKIGGKPAFKGYPAHSKNPFPNTLCISINDEVVHGMAAPNRILKSGDVLSLDAGLIYKGMFTDMAVTVPVGKIDKDAKRLIDATSQSLNTGLKTIKSGADLSDLGRAIEEFVTKKGFYVVRDLTGHGVGRELHEAPSIPNFFDRGFSVILREGMTLAIEPMVCECSHEVFTDDDNWTIKTCEGGRAAHFEATLAVTKNGCEILTPMFW
jgi:methionyl aminopeptidase